MCAGLRIIWFDDFISLSYLGGRKGNGVERGEEEGKVRMLRVEEE